jgi:peptide/nickel transport system ATP-binding protein
MSAETPLLKVTDLAVHFRRRGGLPPLRAVDGVSLDVMPGETVGLVGESGSGKTTIGRAILGLDRPVAGSIRFDDRDITDATPSERRRLSTELQVVFQDPYSSLDPRRTVYQTLSEPLIVHQRMSKSESAAQVATALERVGLPHNAASNYPAAFSGGQRQRIAIARALMLSPRVVICDEVASALDLSIQAQVLNLLRTLQAEFAIGYLFISHDIAVVRYMSHRIVVLYQGEVMEVGPASLITATPAHPYTRALLSAAPVPDPVRQARLRSEREKTIRSNVSIDEKGPGCPFAPRCPYALDICRSVRPELDIDPRGTTVACHRHLDLDLAHVGTAGAVPAAAQGDDVRRARLRTGRSRSEQQH